MLLLIPILLPVVSGTVLLIKKWKKKPWRRPRFVVLSSLVNSAVVLGFLIAQYQESLELAIAGPVTFRLEADGLGSIFAGCMALMIPAILCFFFGMEEDSVEKRERAESLTARSESPKKVKTKKEENDRTVKFVESESRRKNRFISALVNYQFAAILGLAFSKNAATAGFFFLLTILVLAVTACVTRGGAPSEKRNLIFAGVGAAAVFLTLMVAVFGGEGAVFCFDGYLTGKISDVWLQLFYLLCFCGCSVGALAGPVSAGRKKKNPEEKQKEVLLQQKAESSISGTENLLTDAVFAFLLLRMTFSVFGISLLRGSWVQVIVMLLSAAGVCTHAVLALREKDLQKKTEHLTGASFAIMLTGISVMTSHGYTAAVWMSISFSASWLLMTFFVEAVKKKCGSPEEIRPGLGRQMPVTFGCYVVAVLSIAAVPPLAGSLSVWKLAKAFTRQGGLNYLSMAVMFAFLFLAVLSLYPSVINAFFPKYENPGKIKTDEAGLWMLAPMVLLAAAVIAVGIFSGALGEYIYQIGLGLI